MKLITSFDIETSNMSQLAQSRDYTIVGDPGAVFSIRITTADSKSYNFTTTVFDAVETSACRLVNVVLDGNTFNGQIIFPADTSAVYTVELTTSPHFNTKISEEVQGVTSDGINLSYSAIIAKKSIEQIANVNVVLDTIAATTADYTAGSLDQTVTATQSPVVVTPLTKDIDWTLSNTASDAKGFGFTPVQTFRTVVSETGSLGLNIDVLDSSWYAETTITIGDVQSDEGGGSSHFNYNVTKVSNLSLGMVVTGVSSGSLNGTPTITKIITTGLTSKKQLKFSLTQVFADGVVLTVRAYGISAINKALEMNMEVNDMVLTQTPLTKTIRGAVSSSSDVTINGTYGVSKGAFIEGFGVNNSVSNPITEVTASSTAGTIVTTTAQTLAALTVINIIGSSNTYTVKGSITVNSFPSAGKTIYLDLDKILTLGTAS